MYIKQLYTNCLAQAAYYIESNGEAAIIDPLRDVNGYIELARKRNSTIRYIFETHFHADFISGHLDLAEATRATIVFGPTAEASFDFYHAKDDEDFNIGDIMIRALHTPGHTLESTSYLVMDQYHKPHALFTGDTLFVGEVGRPDLATTGELCTEDMAGLLYDSLHKKILTLPDSVIVFPGHGAGSKCGKHIEEDTASTIGTQRRHNRMLHRMDKDAFIEASIAGLEAPPRYFFKNTLINRGKIEGLDKILQRELNPLSMKEFKNEMQNDALVIDTRKADNFVKWHIPGAINIGHDGLFGVWAGAIIDDLNTPVLLVCEEGMEEEMVIRLSRVGFDNIRGYLYGGLDAWIQQGGEVVKLPSVCSTKFGIGQQGIRVIDLRAPEEVKDGGFDTIKMAVEDVVEEASKYSDRNCYLLCKNGYRSAMAGSMLQKEGYTNFINVLGGVEAVNNRVKTIDHA